MDDEMHAFPAKFAIACGYIDCIEGFLNSGVDVNSKDRFGYTLLHEASINGKMECVQLLLNKGANRDAKTAAGKTPSDVAKTPEIKFLIDNYVANIVSNDSLRDQDYEEKEMHIRRI